MLTNLKRQIILKTVKDTNIANRLKETNNHEDYKRHKLANRLLNANTMNETNNPENNKRHKQANRLKEKQTLLAVYSILTD